MDEFAGPYCKQNCLSNELLTEGVNLPQISFISNGLVLEFKSLFEKAGNTNEKVYYTLCQINSAFCLGTVQSVYAKVCRLIENKKKLASKKKLPGFKSVQELLDSQFHPPVPRHAANNEISEHSPPARETANSVNATPLVFHDNNEQPNQTKETQTDHECDIQSDLKNTNLLKYTLGKLTKRNNQLEKTIEEKNAKIQLLDARVGHYSVRNVNKRDQTARDNLTAFRKAQRKLNKQELKCSSRL